MYYDLISIFIIFLVSLWDSLFSGIACKYFVNLGNIRFLIYVLYILLIMSQKPTKRNKDSKEVSEENIEKPIDNEDPAIGEPAEEEAGQRDTKSADAADSADSMIV
jgi:hypothetical protein